MTEKCDNLHEVSANENIADCTGKSWGEWCAILDGWRGDKNRFATIAQYLTDQHQVRRLWAQAIAVYYRSRQGRRSDAAQV
jgi:Domain of unknown function (DUF4287)